MFYTGARWRVECMLAVCFLCEKIHVFFSAKIHVCCIAFLFLKTRWDPNMLVFVRFLVLIVAGFLKHKKILIPNFY